MNAPPPDGLSQAAADREFAELMRNRLTDDVRNRAYDYILRSADLPPDSVPHAAALTAGYGYAQGAEMFVTNADLQPASPDEAFDRQWPRFADMLGLTSGPPGAELRSLFHIGATFFGVETGVITGLRWNSRLRHVRRRWWNPRSW